MADDRTLDPRAQRVERATLSAEACGSSTAARTWQPLVEPGMYVVGVAGDEIGQVKEVRAGDFLVDRSREPGLASRTPIYLPFEHIHAILADRITLDIPASQVDEHGYVPESLQF